MEALRDESVDGVRFLTLRGSTVDDGLLEQMSQLLESAFDGWPDFPLTVPTAEHIRWKLNPPGDRETAVTVTPDGAGLAATSTLLRRTYLLRGVSHTVADGADAAVAPAHQGRGYYSKRRGLSDTIAPDASFGMSFSHNERVLHVRRRVSEAEPANRLQTLELPLSGRRLAAPRHRAAAWLAPLASPLAWAAVLATRWRHRDSLTAPVKPTSIRLIDEFDRAADAFCASALVQFEMVQLRNREYLNWRYCDPRAGDWRVAVAESEGVMAGYVVYRPSSHRAILADLLTLPERLDVAAPLVEFVTSEVRAAGAASVRTWLPRKHPYTPVLKACGYIGIRRSPGANIRIKRLSEDDRRLILDDPDTRIHMMPGDTDMV